MGTFSVVDSSGKLRTIGIKGTTPTPTEQQRIRDWLAQENTKASVKPAGTDTPPPSGFFPAIESGFHGAVQSGYGAIQGIGSLIGNQDLQDWAEQGAELEGQRAQEALPNPMTWENVDGVGDFFQFGAEAIGQSVPYTAAAGLGALGGAIAAPAAPVVAGVLGGAATTYPLLFGSNIERQKEASGEITSVGAAAAAAVPQALAESIVTRFTLGLGKFASNVPTKVLTNKVTKVLSHVTKSAGSESAQEVSQQILERLQAGLPIDNEDAYREYYNAAAAAAIAGGAFGTVGAFNKGRENNAADDTGTVLQETPPPGPEITARFDDQIVPVDAGFTGNDDNDSVRNTLATIARGELVPNKPVVRGTFGGQQFQSGREERPVRASGQFGTTEFNRPPRPQGYRGSSAFDGDATRTGETASADEALRRWREGDFVPPPPIQTGVFGTTPFATGERYVAPKPGIQFGDTEFNRPVRTRKEEPAKPEATKPTEPPKPSEFSAEKYQAALAYTQATGQADWVGLRKATGLNPKMAMRLRQEMVQRGDLIEDNGKYIPAKAVTPPPVPEATTKLSIEPVATKATGQDEAAPAYAVVQKIVDESGNTTSSAPIEVVKTEEEAKQALAALQAQSTKEEPAPAAPKYPPRAENETAGQYGTRLAKEGFSPDDVVAAIKENRPSNELDVLRAASSGKTIDETPGWREFFREGLFDIETNSGKMTLTPEGKNRLSQISPRPKTSTKPSTNNDDIEIPEFLRRFEKPVDDYFLDINSGMDAERLDRIGRVIDKKIGNYFPSNVKLNLTNYVKSRGTVVPVRGSYTRGTTTSGDIKRVITVAIGMINNKMSDAEIAARLASTIDHEIIHALKDMGLFTDQEWGSLVKYATKVPEVQEWVQRAGYDAADVNEESVARLFQLWGQGDIKLSGQPRSLVQRIIEFFKRLAGLATDKDVKEIFDRIVSGEVNARQSGDASSTASMDERGTNINSPAFKNWFNGSQVVDRHGNPKIVYHFTPSTFRAFDTQLSEVGSHFGTQAQSNSVFIVQGDNRRGSTYPVYLSIKNPIRLEDKGNFDAIYNVMPQLADIFEGDPDFKDMYDATGYYINSRQSNDIIQRFLKKKGYDGIVYLNRAEGFDETNGEKPSSFDLQNLTDEEFMDRFPEAEDSWIAFDPGQIKSIANKGTFDPANPDILYEKSRNIDTWQFRHWFGNSKIVNPDGSPKVVYHGTDSNFNEFSKGKLGSNTGAPSAREGFFFTDRPKTAHVYSQGFIPWQERVQSDNIIYDEIRLQEKLAAKGASHYTKLSNKDVKTYAQKRVEELRQHLMERGGPNIMPVYLSIQNPLVHDFKGARWRDVAYKQLIDNAKRLGHDGVIMTRTYDGGQGPLVRLVGAATKGFGSETIYVAFEPSQIKSVANSGEFNRDNPDIRYEKEAKYERDDVATAQSPVLNSRNSDPSSRATSTQFGKRVPATPDNIAQNITYTAVNDWIARRTAKMPERFRPSKAKVESVIEYLQDKMITLGALVDHVRKNGGVITDATDPYMRDELRASASGDLIKANEKGIYKDAINSVNAVGFDSADLSALAASNPTASKFLTSDTYKDTNTNVPMVDLYLYAKAAPERNARLADETVGPMGSGMSDRDANQIRAWFEKHPKFAGLVRAEAAVRKIIENTNETRVNAGLIPKGLQGEKFYVPLRGFLDEDIDPDESNDDWARSGQGLQVRWKEDRKPLGRGTLSSNILNRVILQNEEAIIRAGKANVGQSFVRMILNNEQMLAGMADIIRVPPVKRVRIGNKVRLMVDPKYKDDPNVYTVKLSEDLAERLGGDRQAGDEISVTIHNDRLASAMKGGLINEDSKRSMIRVMGKVNNFLTSMNTTFNPAFFLPNFFRDLITAGVNLKQYEDIGGVEGLTPALMGNLRESFAAMRRFHRGGTSDKAIDKMREEMAKAGGFTEFYGLRTLEDTVRRTNALISQDLSGGSKQALAQSKKAFGAIKNFVEDYNSVFENTTRLAVYKTLRDKGFSVERAAQAAKNLTVNFNKAGAGKPLLNAMYLFYNAGIQGSWAIANAGLRSRKVRKAMVGIIAAGVVQDIMMGMMSPEDDDGKLVYDKIPDWQLEHNMVFLDPLGLSERGYFMIPLPYGFNAFFNAGRATARMARGGADIGSTLGSIAGATVGAFNPIGGTNHYLNFVAPTIADPFIDLARNRDFADRPIVPETSGFGVDRPASQLYWNNTSPLYVKPAEWLSSLSGGIGRIPGDVEVSPEVLQFWTEYILGGVGSFVRQSFGVGLSGVDAAVTGAWPEIESGDIPMVRRLYGNISSRNDLENYVVNRDKVMAVDASIRTALESGDTGTITEVISRYPNEYKLSATIRKIESMRTKIGGQIRDIEANPNIPSDRKRELIDALKERQDQLVGMGNRIMADL